MHPLNFYEQHASLNKYDLSNPVSYPFDWEHVP